MPLPRTPYSAAITAVEHYLPDKVVTNADIEKLVDTSDEWITTRTGIKQRHVAEKFEMTSDLACEAAKNALEDAKIKATDVDLNIVVTTTPDDPFPATAVKVKSRLSITGGAACDILAAFSGFIYSLSFSCIEKCFDSNRTPIRRSQESIFQKWKTVYEIQKNQRHRRSEKWRK